MPVNIKVLFKRFGTVVAVVVDNPRVANPMGVAQVVNSTCCMAVA